MRSKRTVRFVLALGFLAALLGTGCKWDWDAWPKCEVWGVDSSGHATCVRWE